MQRDTVVCLMGPTASGKTALALALAEIFPIEIINVDSAQFYRGMDIGSGKATSEERSKTPHHLIDICCPMQPYSVAQFCEAAYTLIAQIKAQGRIPLLVGGTMMYFHALQKGLSALPASSTAVREELVRTMHREGLACLYKRLQERDPKSALRIRSTDTQRILRALEVLACTGLPMSHWIDKPINVLAVPPYRFVNLALVPLETARAVLHQRIQQRFFAMLEAGFIQEVERLRKRYGDLTVIPAFKAVGYRQIVQYLYDELTYEQMCQQALAATRQLAKRQLTWLRRWPELITFDFLAPALLEKCSPYFF